MFHSTRLRHEHSAVCTMHKSLDKSSGTKPVRCALGVDWATHGGGVLRRRRHNFCERADGVQGDLRRFTTIKESIWGVPKSQEVQRPSDWRMEDY